MSRDRAALVGRGRHVAELSLLVDGAKAGRGNLVVLSGEAGAGKTRLAEEAAALASAEGLEVGWATGWGAGAAPLSTWSDLLAGVEPRLTPDVRAVSSAEEVDPETARAVFVRSLVAKLREAVRGRPVLLVVDDVQWCDPLSLHAVEVLVASIRSSPIGLLATLRDDGASSVARFATLLRRGRHLMVPPLTDDELGELALDLTGRQLSPQAIARLRDRSAGNVLFATELLASGASDALAGRDAPGGAASSAVAVFGGRLAGLSPECQQMLEAASVIGRRFRLDVLAETLGLPDETLLDSVGDAHRAGLVRESGIGAYEFSHPLMAEACYASAGLPRRTRLHRDVGEALERLRGSRAGHAGD